MSLYTDPLYIEAEIAWRRQRDAVNHPEGVQRRRLHLPTWLGGRRRTTRTRPSGRSGRGTTPRPA